MDAWQRLHGICFSEAGVHFQGQPPLLDGEGCWIYPWWTPSLVWPLNFYQLEKNQGLPDMTDLPEQRSQNVQNRYRIAIANWMCRRLPDYGERIKEVCHRILDELNLESLTSRSIMAHNTLGIVHLIKFTNCLKLGASHLSPNGLRKDLGLTKRLQFYKRNYAPDDIRLEGLPAVVVCRTPAQALQLEGFLHRFMRRFYSSMVIPEYNELYSLEAEEILLAQLYWRAKRSAQQLRSWNEWCDQQSGVLPPTDTAEGEENSSVGL